MRSPLDPERLRHVYDRAARRYDSQHALLTAGSDQRGRRMVVEKAVRHRDTVLDCGAGTGSTALLAASRVGPGGSVTLLDMSEGMLAVARDRAEELDLRDRLTFQIGDSLHLPFDDNCFDAVLSTYSLCPLQDPARGALELYRVARPGGRIGIAHSTHPEAALIRWWAEKLQAVAARFPSIALGCRSISVLTALERAGGRVSFQRRIGVPLWPFLVLVMEKPATD